MSLAQKITLGITALLFFLLSFAWLFSDASLDNPLAGLFVQYAGIGIPAYLLYKIVGKSKH